MTIAATSRADYIGTGSLATYAFPYPIVAASDLLVTKRDTAGVETTLALNTDYTVAGVGVATGGSITLLAGNLPTSYALTIRRVVSLAQAVDIRNQSGFFPEVIENEFDKLASADQQEQDGIDRALRVAETDAAITRLPAVAQRLGKFLAFDAAGQPTVSSGSGGGDTSLRTDLAASGGAALVGFLAAGAGAVARTTQDKAYDTVSALDFMTAAQKADVRAKTALVDVSAAVQAALTFARVVTLPEGIYYMGTTGLTISVAAQCLRGSGESTILLWASAFTGAGITISASGATLEDFYVSKPWQAALPAATIIGINNTSNTGSYINVKVTSEGSNTYLGWGIGIQVATYTHRFVNCRASGARYGLFGNLSNYITAVNCPFSAQTVAAVGLSGGNGNALIGCDYEGTSPYGLYIDDGGTANSGAGTLTITGGYLEGFVTTGIAIIGSVGPGKNVRGVTITGLLLSGMSACGNAINCVRASGVTITGCYAVNYTTNSVVVGGSCTDVVVLGNQLNQAATFDATSTGFMQNSGGTALTFTGQSIKAPFFNTGASSVLAITANVIAPTGKVHHVGAGLIKTITVPALLSVDTITIIPDAAFTYDATGNIVVPAAGGTAVINKAMTFTWDGTKWTPSY